MDILVTAFDPFYGNTMSSPLETLSLLGECAGPARVHKLVLPSVFYKSLDVLHEAIGALTPDALIMLGQSGGKNCLSCERSAKNLIDAHIPDNAGRLIKGTQVYPDGPEQYPATLPVEGMSRAINDAGVPCVISCCPGAFVCNQTMYGALYLADKESFKLPSAFIHIPYTPLQALAKGSLFCMESAEAARGVEAALFYTADYLCSRG